MPSFLGRTTGRRHERKARTTLRAAGDPTGQPVQLLGQVWPPALYERFRAAHHAKLRARQIVLPAARGPFMLILWGLEPGAEAAPDLRDMPLAIGTPIAVAGRDDQSNPHAAFGIAVESWVALNRGHGLGPFAFAPPVLEVRTPSNGVQREVITFGQKFPLPLADGLIPRTQAVVRPRVSCDSRFGDGAAHGSRADVAKKGTSWVSI